MGNLAPHIRASAAGVMDRTAVCQIGPLLTLAARTNVCSFKNCVCFMNLQFWCSMTKWANIWCGMPCFWLAGHTVRRLDFLRAEVTSFDFIFVHVASSPSSRWMAVMILGRDKAIIVESREAQKGRACLPNASATLLSIGICRAIEVINPSRLFCFCRWLHSYMLQTFASACERWWYSAEHISLLKVGRIPPLGPSMH